MRILHTSDWHLGHQLHDISRDYEHRHFLTWLRSVIVDEQVDALLVAGDLFDTANPPAASLALFYDFIAALKRDAPNVHIVVIGGNHDSPTRLDAPVPVLDVLGVRVVGGLPRLASGEGEIDVDRLIVKIPHSGGVVWVGAIPFLRPGDLGAVDTSSSDATIRAVRSIYNSVTDAIRLRMKPGDAIVLMGHGTMVGGSISEMSERRILRGDSHALPDDIFAVDVSYVALGHLHLPQQVGARANVRYSGAPLALAMNEADYPHQVCVVDLHESRADVRALRVPKALELLCIPKRDRRSLSEILPMLAELPARSAAQREDMLPLLEVRVALDSPAPSLRREVEAAVADRAVRLVSIVVTRERHDSPDAPAVEALAEMQPIDIFRARYAREFDGEPPDDLIAAFNEILSVAQHSEGR